jgi:hypothetical protein
LHRGHVAQAHGAAVAPLENQVGELIHGITARESHGVLPPADVDEAAGDVVRIAGHLRDTGDLDAQLRRARRIEDDL